MLNKMLYSPHNTPDPSVKMRNRWEFPYQCKGNCSVFVTKTERLPLDLLALCYFVSEWSILSERHSHKSNNSTIFLRSKILFNTVVEALNHACDKFFSSLFHSKTSNSHKYVKLMNTTEYVSLQWSTNFGWLSVMVTWIHYLYVFGPQNTKINLKFFD
jgi:hypothetical protein